MLMPLLMTLTLVAQVNSANNDSNDNNSPVQSFAERLKASHEQKKPAAIEAEDDNAENTPSHATRHFQVRMTQTVAGRR